jgi:hypothetical protein
MWIKWVSHGLLESLTLYFPISRLADLPLDTESGYRKLLREQEQTSIVTETKKY